jgi:hypothetical protein
MLDCRRLAEGAEGDRNASAYEAEVCHRCCIRSEFSGKPMAVTMTA